MAESEPAQSANKLPTFNLLCFKFFWLLDFMHLVVNFAFIITWIRNYEFYPLTWTSALLVITVPVVMNGLWLTCIQRFIKTLHKTQDSKIWIKSNSFLVFWYFVSNYVILIQIVFFAIALSVPEIDGIFYSDDFTIPMGIPILVIGSFLLVSRCFYRYCVRPELSSEQSLA